jgi:site-specific DNA-cytosine methylase
MKVLDLFCGRGGWSIPFIEDYGDDVWGIDIQDLGYPGHFIKADIHQLDGYGFHDADFIIGSPPCTEFSIAKEFGKYGKGQKRDLEKGLNLIADFYRFVQEAKPRWWAMENVSNLEQWWPEPPIWQFKISKGGYRTLWGTLPQSYLPYDFHWKRNIWKQYRNPADRAMIPRPIAEHIAGQVHLAYSKLKLNPQTEAWFDKKQEDLRWETMHGNL